MSMQWRVITAGAPSTAPGLIGLKHLAGYKSFMRALYTCSSLHQWGVSKA